MKLNLDSVKQTLWQDWDPIGMRQIGGPADEYDSYAPDVLAMLRAGTTEEDLVAHLHSIATTQMGLHPPRAHYAARALLRLSSEQSASPADE